MIHHLRKPKLLIGAGVLIAGLVGGTLFAGRTHAAFTVCVTDPVVTLSNGVTVTMVSQLNIDPSQVQHIHYVLHVPHHLQATSITYDQYGYLEDVQIVQDQNGNRFMTETEATTSVPAEVLAYARLSAGEKSGLALGKNGSDLVIQFESGGAF